MKQALANLFLAAAAAVTERLEQAGLPQSIDVERTVVGRVRPTGWSAEKRPVAQSVLTLDQATLPDPPWLGEVEITAVRACAAALADLAGDRLTYWVPFPGPVGPLVKVGPYGPQFANDPADWAATVVVLPALFHHLAALPSVANADESAAQAFADAVLMVATAPDLRYLLSLPLSGIHLDELDALTAGNVSVRRLSAAEQGAIFDQRGGWDSVTAGFAELPHTVLELRVSGPRNEQHLRSDEQVPSLITAFQLQGYHIVGHYIAARAEPPWTFSGVIHHPVTLPRQPRQSALLTAEGFQAVAATAKHLERYHISEPASVQDLALHRFSAGLARDAHADGVLDFTIALEALLLPYDRNARRGDLGYRFRVHGAHYFSERADDRREIADRLTEVYEMRSRLVHGAKYPDRVEVRAAHDAAYDFARRGLLRAVEEGFPTAATFNDMVLG